VTQTTAYYVEKVIIGNKKNRKMFRGKFAKNANISDHNIGPSLSLIFRLKFCNIGSSSLKLLSLFLGNLIDTTKLARSGGLVFVKSRSRFRKFFFGRTFRPKPEKGSNIILQFYNIILQFYNIILQHNFTTQFYNTILQHNLTINTIHLA
jgi:hypothetical protein